MIPERIRKAIFGEKPIQKANETIFPWAKMDFRDGVFGDGEQALHNAYRQQFIIPGDALQLTLITPEESSLQPRAIDVYYVGPAEPLFSPNNHVRPMHIIYINSLASAFRTISQIGEWKVVEKESPTHVRKSIERYASAKR